jgi:hypothetical protein
MMEEQDLFPAHFVIPLVPVCMIQVSQLLAKGPITTNTILSQLERIRTGRLSSKKTLLLPVLDILFPMRLLLPLHPPSYMFKTFRQSQSHPWVMVSAKQSRQLF